MPLQVALQLRLEIGFEHDDYLSNDQILPTKSSECDSVLAPGVDRVASFSGDSLRMV